ncbi:MAG: DMT family transporter [Oceanicaulis sp.]
MSQPEDPSQGRTPAQVSGSGRGDAFTLAALFLGMAAFGSATPVSKIVTESAPVFVGSLFRVLVGALALAPFAWLKREDIAGLRRADWGRIAVIAAFGMFGFTALMLYGMRMISGVAGAVVMSTAPMVTALAAITFMSDRATWRKLAAAGLAVAGVLILHLGGGEDRGATTSWLGIALVFAAVCCEAVYTLMGRTVTRRVDPLLTAFLAAAMSLPFFAAPALWQWPQFEIGETNTRFWAAVAWYGAGTLAIGSGLWYAGVKRAPGSIAAAFMGVMPVSALVLSYVLLDEAFHWIHLAGFAVVFSGVALVSWEHARHASK